jgi:hypothetical protein
MKKCLLAVAAMLLLLVGCTSGESASSSSSTTTTRQEEAPSGPSPGVTDDAIKVGITYIDFETIKEVTEVRHGDYEGAYKALIEDLNERGGINGRKIEPVFAPVSPIGTDSADAACARLTQDEEVFVVLGFFQADAVICPVDTHETAVIGGTMTEERLARAKAPWYTTEAGGDLDQDAIRALADAGELDGKVGVVATIQGEAALRSQAEPLLEELGIEPVDVAVIDAPENDVAAQNSAVQVIAERFRSSGVDKVLVYGEAGITWANGMVSAAYRPKLLFTGLNAILAFSNDPTKDVGLLKGSMAAAPYQGRTDEFEPSLEPCFDIVEEATGETLLTHDEAKARGVGDNFVAPAVACTNLALFEAIAEEAGDDLNYGTFRKAGDELGEIELPGSPNPYTFGPPPHADGDAPVGLFEWDPATREFVAEP